MHERQVNEMLRLKLQEGCIENKVLNRRMRSKQRNQDKSFELFKKNQISCTTVSRTKIQKRAMVIEKDALLTIRRKDKMNLAEKKKKN